jgi:non-specific serine/threonine protein kinase
MAWTLGLTPHGRLLVVQAEGVTNAGTEADWADLDASFSQGSAQGLLALVHRRVTADQSGSSGLFWREFAERCLTALAHAPETTNEGAFPDSVPMPPGLGEELTLQMPVMPGAEYAGPQVFAALWAEIVAVGRADAPKAGGLRAWLSCVHPAMHLLGRVTFHLAENKRVPDKPFAFMATYTHRLAGGEKPVHLPMARALQEYAGANNQSALRSLLDPVQKAASLSAWTRELLETRQIFQPQAWTADQAYNFLREVPALESSGIITRIPNWWKNGRGARPKISVRIGGASGSSVGVGSLLDFSLETSIGGEPLTQKEWDELMRSGEGLVSLRGQWVEVDRDKLNQVLDHWKKVATSARGEGVSFLEAMRLLAGFRPGSSEIQDETIEREWSEVVADGALQEMLSQLADPAKAVAFDPNEHLQARLRSYQEVGVKWLWLLQKIGLGACLADDMGLGKTIQIIALLLRLKQEQSGVRGSSKGDMPRTSLLIAPASLLANWMGELARFAPSLRAVCLHPSSTPANQWKEGASAQKLLADYDLAITTYGQAARLPWIADHPWRLLVLDEAQAIKNPGSQQTRAVKKISARARIALSGTPVENRLGDLWSLYDFLNPGLLGSAGQFADAVKRLQASDPPDFGPLRRLVRPYLLRRLKTDRSIIADLPDKTEITAWCSLVKAQAALYQKTVLDLAEKLNSVEDTIQRRGLVLAYLMRFKQICNHPSQWSGDGSFAPEASGKFARLTELAEEIASRQEKVLVFTQFREMTDPLADSLRATFGRPGLVLHGGTPVRQRRGFVEDFQREEGPPFFVLSLKAGGTGLNLTAANHVIHFDRWWNPAVENQATDRAFRIGQKRSVLVHKFVCRGTIEERIDALITEKRALADSVLGGGGGAESLLTEMSNDELLRFVSLDIRSAIPE